LGLGAGGGTGVLIRAYCTSTSAFQIIAAGGGEK
jgi:hypothetical protein